MVRDQATDLRDLVRRTSRLPLSSGPAARLVVLAGGKKGVGVTTLSLNLAMALSELGARVVLVDANLQQAGIASLCGISAGGGVADILAARRDIHEVILRGPAGTQIVPGVWDQDPSADLKCNEAAQLRLVQQIKALDRHTELVLLDVGAGCSDLSRRVWREADHVLLVTSPDNLAVMDAYATIKSIGVATTPVHLVANRCVDARQAEDVLDRIAQSCEKFLGRQVGRLGYLPEDPHFARALGQVGKNNMQAAEAPANVALNQLAEALQRLLARSGVAAAERI